MRHDDPGSRDPTIRPVTVTARTVETVVSYQKGAGTVTVRRVHSEAGTTRLVWDTIDDVSPGDRFTFTVAATPVDPA